MAKGKKKQRKLDSEARAFINGSADSVAVGRGETVLGYSPARAQAAMCRTPDRRARHKAARRGKSAAIDASTRGE